MKRESNYAQLKKDFDLLFGDDKFFTITKLLQLAKDGYDTKLVARGHMTVDLDKHNRPVYTSKTWLESHDFVGPKIYASNANSFLALFFSLLIFSLCILLLVYLLSWQYPNENLNCNARDCWKRVKANCPQNCDSLKKCCRKSKKKLKKSAKKTKKKLKKCCEYLDNGYVRIGKREKKSKKKKEEADREQNEALLGLEEDRDKRKSKDATEDPKEDKLVT